MATQRRVSTVWMLLPVFLLGAALRLVGIYNVSPPGLEHDEVANWLIDRAILGGQHAIYFTEAYGHEAGFHYVQAAFVALLGDNALSLRLPAAFMGVLGIAVTFVLARQLFGPRIAFTSAALVAVLFFPVFFSRLGLRAIMLPMLAGLSAYFWWRGWGVNQRLGERHPEHHEGSKTAVFQPAHASHHMLIAGALAGLSLHTYMAARAVPIFYALYFAALFVLKPREVRARWRQLLLFWLALAVVAAPLVLYLLTNRGAEFRISEINAPLRALTQGNVGPVVDNAVDILGSFGFAGDPLWRQNVAFLPLLDPLLALFFYACLGLAVLYVKDIRYLFLILWLLTATIPSMVTIDAPSSIRMINILPVLTILPAIVMHILGQLSTKSARLSTGPVDKWGLPMLVASLVLLNIGRTVYAVYATWPANEEVRFVWQEALTDAAGFLDRSPRVQDVAVGGWTPDSMDPPTMALTLRREDLALRYFDPQQSLLIPQAKGGAPSLILRPAVLPFNPALRRPLQAGAIVSETIGSFVYYAVSEMPQPKPQVMQEIDFGGEIALLGFTPSPACLQPDDVSSCVVVTFWRVLQTPAGQRRIFLHAVDREGTVVATGDALGAPALYWHPGDLILQKHEIAGQRLKDYDVMRLGVYDPLQGQRLLTRAGGDFELLHLDARE